MSKLIQYKSVEICQDEQIVLRDIDLEVSSGEMIYLLGRVGTGKSTFMKTLYAELELEGVQAEVLGYNLLKMKRKHIPYLRRKVGVVFQDFQLLTDRSVEDNLMFVLKATGWKDKQAMKNNIHDVLRQVGMENKAYKMPHQLNALALPLVAQITQPRAQANPPLPRQLQRRWARCIWTPARCTARWACIWTATASTARRISPRRAKSP